MKDEDYEIPPCTLTGKVHYKNFPWGAYHLNLTDPIRVAQCKETGMLYLCPRPSRKNREEMLKGILPDALRAYGERTYNYAAVDKLRSTDFEERLQQFDSLFTHPNKSILDVGTSGGNFMDIAIQHGWIAKGIEPFPDDVELCRGKGLDVILGVAELLPFSDNSFDVVHTSHVFEHLEDPLQAAKEAWRVLKPGGMLFVEVPNQLDNFGFHRDVWFKNVQQRSRGIASIHHLWFFGRKTLKELFLRAHFSDIKVLNKHHPLFPGWRLPFSLISRVLSDVFYGTYIIRGIGFKPKTDE